MVSDLRQSAVTVKVNSRTGVVSTPGEPRCPPMRKAVVQEWVEAEPKVQEWTNALAKMDTIQDIKSASGYICNVVSISANQSFPF